MTLFTLALQTGKIQSVSKFLCQKGHIFWSEVHAFAKVASSSKQSKESALESWERRRLSRAWRRPSAGSERM